MAYTPDDPQREFVAVGEASRILRCSQELTRLLAKRGDLPSFRLGNGHRIFRRVDVEKLARARHAGPR